MSPVDSTLHHRERGQGRPLVLLHGFPHDGSLWDGQLTSLAAHARVVVPDLRGFGSSPAAPDGFSIDDHAADVKDLLDGLRLDRAVVCGLSMGGYVALALAAAHPDALDGLVLVSTRPGADGDEARRGREANAIKALSEGTPAVAGPMVEKMVTPRAGPEVSERVRRMMVRQSPQGVAAALRAMAGRPDRSSLLPTLRVRTLVVHGREDALIPPGEAEAMADAIPGARLVLIDGAAHLPHLEAPAEFDQALAAFLAGR